MDTRTVASVVVPVLVRLIAYRTLSPAESPATPSVSSTEVVATDDRTPVLLRAWVAVAMFVTKPPDAGDPSSLWIKETPGKRSDNQYIN